MASARNVPAISNASPLKAAVPSRIRSGAVTIAAGLAFGRQPMARAIAMISAPCSSSTPITVTVLAAIVTAPLLILLGTAAFSGLALLMAGTLRAEATLAAANLVYILLLGLGGVVFPLTRFPAAARPVLELLPTGALSTGLRDVLQYGVAFPVGNTVTLAVWAVAAIALAARTFRWD